MDPISAAASVVLPIVGRLIGEALAAGDREKAEKLRREAAQMYGEEAVQKMMVETELAPESKMTGVQADPQAVALQREALARLAEQARTTGMTAEEKLLMQQAQDEAAQYERGQREAITQNAQARGVGGSGYELAQQLAAQQGGAMRANQGAMEGAAMAARRQALANLQMGEFAGKFRGQGFDEDAQRAGAQDAVAKFNAAATNQGRQFNSGVMQHGADQRLRQANINAGAYDDKATDTSNMWAATGNFAGQTLGGQDPYGDPKKKKGW